MRSNAIRPAAWRSDEDNMVRAILRPLYVLLAVFVVGMASAVSALAYHQIGFQGRAFPGVRLQGMDLSGMTPEEVFFVAQSHADYFHSPVISLRSGETTFDFRPSDFGVGLDPAETARVAMSIGRVGDWQEQLQQRFEAWWRGVDSAAVVSLDDGAAERIIARVAKQTERAPQDARIVFENGTAREIPSQTGLELDQTAALRLVRAAIERNQSADISLPYKTLEPRIATAASAANDIARIIGGDLVVMAPKWDDKDQPIAPVEAFRIRGADLQDFVVLDEVVEGNAAKIQARIKREKLRGLIEPLAQAVQQQPVNARLTFDERTGKLSAIAPSRDGRTLDIEATLDALEAAARSENRGDSRQVTLAVKVDPPPIPADASAQQLGITSLITQATTFFKGSSAARLNNVKTAAARFHGVVIPPGATFSFNEFLGDVSTKEGFQEGLVIVGNRTVKGVGGGVCQVSTTAYQAALRAGFPIVERYPHGYRVSYYERGMGPGFDATVFSPYADFKFVNDTSAHLLIETFYDPAKVTLTFRFYGTPDGREIAITPSTVSDIVPHGPDVYEPDADNEVPAAKARQVDFAVDGATISFKRTVTRGGEMLIDERVVSKYVPWQNVFRYGPEFKPPEGALVKDPNQPVQPAQPTP
jgi:vancomycin resistance protein YoaR